MEFPEPTPTVRWGCPSSQHLGWARPARAWGPELGEARKAGGGGQGGQTGGRGWAGREGWRLTVSMRGEGHSNSTASGGQRGP